MKNTKTIAGRFLLTKVRTGVFVISEILPDAALSFCGYLKKDSPKVARPKRYREWWLNGYVAAGPSLLIQDIVKH